VKNILIIGNSSIISKSIISLANKKKINIYSSFFSKKNDARKNSFYLDLTNENTIDEFYNKIKKVKFDTVIILSATQARKNIAQYNKTEIYKVLKTNVIGITLLINKIINSFKKKSTLVIISSSSFLNGGYDVVYSISKSVLSTLSRSLSKHFGHKFKTITLLPGLINGSNQVKLMKKNRVSYHKKNTPVKKLLKAEDVAKIIFDLNNDHWLSANGSEIRLDGGYRG
tara:strand:- start:51 stop:731 length:681 start_codon:yes stop_codon:yes gene_type:complete